MCIRDRVFSDGDRSMGLMVDTILDVVEERLAVDGAGERPGYLGSIVVAGKVRARQGITASSELLRGWMV